MQQLVVAWCNREALAALHRQLGKHPARVFTFAGQPIANANTRAWRNALKRAGIEDFRWHDFMAYMGKLAQNAGDTHA